MDKKGHSMLYNENWDKTSQRLDALWQNEIVDRCCISVIAPKTRDTVFSEPAPKTQDELRKWYLDGPTLADRWERMFEKQYYGGDGYPCLWSNFGTAGHAKYIRGAKYQFTPETVWFEPTIRDWESDMPVFDPSCAILDREVETMKYLAARGMGKYYVSMPDNCGVMDSLAHLRGTDNLLIDLIDEPEQIPPALNVMTDALKAACVRQFEVIRENNDGGCVHGWMLTRAPGTHMQLQVDFSVMISPAMYEEFAMPELEAMTNWLDYSTYHLDGQEQIRHLDMLLSLPRLNMIQWTPVAGQPPTSDFIPVLQKIQKAGKGLVLYPSKKEVEKLLDGLSPKGLFLHVRDAVDEEEAREVVKLADRMACRRP